MPVVYSGAGEVEPVTMVVPLDVDCTGGDVQVCLGSYALPSGDWTAPDSAAVAVGGLSVTVTVTIGNGAVNPAAGTYWLWVRVSGAPDAGDVILGRSTAPVKVVTDTGVPLVTYPQFVASVNGERPDQAGNVTVTGGTGGTGGAVGSVFGRTGAVAAQAGDYTAGQVGADPAGSATAAQAAAVAAAHTDAAAQITALGLGSASTHPSTDFATSAQGTLADSAVQPGSLGGAASLNVGTGAGTVAAGDDARITGAASAADLAAETARAEAAEATKANSADLGTAAGHAAGDFATSAQGAKADTAVQSSIGTAKGDLIGFTAAGTPARLPAAADGAFLAYDSTAATGLSAQVALTASSLTLGVTQGELKRPWGAPEFIGEELWTLANMSTDLGGQNSTLTPSATGNGTNNATVTRFRVGYPLADGQVAEAFRFDYTLDFTSPSGWAALSIRGTDVSGNVVGNEVFLYTAADGVATGYRSTYDFSYPALSSGGVRYIEVTLRMVSNATTGVMTLSNVSLRQIPAARPGLNVSWQGGTGPQGGTGGSLYCDIPVTDPDTGVTAWLRNQFSQDGALAISPTGLTSGEAYASNYATSPGSITSMAASNFMSGTARYLHVGNCGQVLGVVKTDGSTELRCNTHGGEAGRSGTWTTDFVFEMDYGDGQWHQFNDVGHTHQCRRLRITCSLAITRSDQGSPFADSDLVFTLFDDGTMRFDRTLTFLADQQMFQWFYFMHSFDPSVLEPGRQGYGQQVITGFDPRQYLTTPAAATASTGSGGTYGALTRTYYTTAGTPQGETLLSAGVSATSTGSGNSFTVTQPATQTGQTWWAVYDSTGRISPPLPVAQSTWTDTAPTYGSVKAPTVSAATVLPGTQVYTRLQSDKADWAAFYDSDVSGVVFGTITDRDNALTYPGATALTAELDSHPGVMKNYWQLFDGTGNVPLPAAAGLGGYRQTIPNGTVLQTTAFTFTYSPLDKVNWHREIANRGQGFKQFSQVYPSS